MLYNTTNGQAHNSSTTYNLLYNKFATSQCQSPTSRHVQMLVCGKLLSVGGEFVVQQVVELLWARPLVVFVVYVCSRCPCSTNALAYKPTHPLSAIWCVNGSLRPLFQDNPSPGWVNPVNKWLIRWHQYQSHYQLLIFFALHLLQTDLLWVFFLERYEWNPRPVISHYLHSLSVSNFRGGKDIFL